MICLYHFGDLSYYLNTPLYHVVCTNSSNYYYLKNFWIWTTCFPKLTTTEVKAHRYFNICLIPCTEVNDSDLFVNIIMFPGKKLSKIHKKNMKNYTKGILKHISESNLYSSKIPTQVQQPCFSV